MPHQCTACGRTFEDGSKEMLSGCPDCGGNKFQFKPAGATDGSAGETATSGASTATARKKTPENAGHADRPAPETEGDDGGSAVNRAASTVRDWVNQRDDGPESGRNPSSADEPSPADETRHPVAENARPSAEDSAQASARSDVVSDSELPPEPSRNGSAAEPAAENGAADADADAADGAVDSGPDADADSSPGLKELREELNSQFESIRIVEPGQYELNLMELYEREEYIVSLQEDGKYVIEVPDAWDAPDRE